MLEAQSDLLAGLLHPHQRWHSKLIYSPDAQLLGRADNMSEFVLQGESEGWVEITLSRDNDGRSIAIRRHLRTRDNHSDWKIDGEDLLFRQQAVASRAQLASHTYKAGILACYAFQKIIVYATGRAAKKEDVLKAVKDLHVQLDNLCQVVPWSVCT